MTSRPFLASTDPSIRRTEQLWLTDFDPHPQIHRLFLALRFDPATASTLALLAEQSRAKHGLHRRALLTEHFHLSLHLLNEDAMLRTDLIARATDALAHFTASPFSVTLDRLMSFDRKKPTQAVVLCESPENKNTALHQFHHDLGAALQRARLGRFVQATFKPHITLVYDPQSVPAHRTPPLTWTVTDFTLIESLHGQTRHLEHHRWPLRS